MKNVITIFLFSIIISCGQISKGHITYANLEKHVLKHAVYDTLDADFLLEREINAYRFGDIKIKKNGFIIFSNNIKQSYLKSYFIFDISLASCLAKENTDFKYDEVSLALFDIKHYNIKEYNSIYNHGVDSSIRLNPFCGQYYEKIHLKIEVAYLGKVFQRIPACLSCKEIYDSLNHKKDFFEKKVPTYLIVKIF